MQIKNIFDVIKLHKDARNPLWKIVIWNLEKRKSQKLKSSIFDELLIVNQTFSQTEFIIGKLYFAHIMHFHQTKCLIFVKLEIMVSIQFCKSSTGLSFCVGWAKKLRNLPIAAFKKLYCRVHCYIRVRGMKHSLKKTFTLYANTASSGKSCRKWLPLAAKCFSFKIGLP